MRACRKVMRASEAGHQWHAVVREQSVAGGVPPEANRIMLRAANAPAGAAEPGATDTDGEERTMLERTPGQARELKEITIKTDTRDILSHATKQMEGYEDYFLVDIDAHVTETQFWPEIVKSIDNEVIRHMAEGMSTRPGTSTAR